MLLTFFFSTHSLPREWGQRLPLAEDSAVLDWAEEGLLRQWGLEPPLRAPISLVGARRQPQEYRKLLLVDLSLPGPDLPASGLQL